MAIEKFNVVLTAYQDLTPTVRHFHFVRSDGLPLSFIPGQFLSFLFDVSGETKRRSYSIASAPGSLTLELSVAYVPGGLASEILFNLKPGDTLKVLGPAGRLILADAPIKRHILVGTGTGMAPYRSMLPAIEERLEAGESVVVLEGVQYRKDGLYIQEFMSSLGQHPLAKFCLCLSRESLETQAPYEYSGYVQQRFADLALDPSSDIVYLCGNPNMIDECFAFLLEQGFASDKVRREKYISS